MNQNGCIILHSETMAKRNGGKAQNWITAEEAAGLIGVTKQYVTQLIRAGVFEARRVGNRLWLVNRISLEGWERKRKRKDKPIE